jgi:mannosyltransferase OCH1-like enzyme
MVHSQAMTVDTATDAIDQGGPVASAVAEAPRIPLLGHYVWVGAHRPPQEMMDSWPKMNPGMIWSLWTDHTAKGGWENQEQIDKRAARKEWNGVADIMRYEILWKFGGIAVDADSECVRPLSEGDFFAQETAVACYEHEMLRPGIIGCGFLGAPKGHSFFRACIDSCAKQDASIAAWKAVGPMCMVRVAECMPSAIRIYPSRMFNPKHYSGRDAPGDATIFAQQGWGSTKGYNSLRKLPCQCQDCWVSMFNAPWM